MPDHVISQDFELKLEEISMKIFENTTKKRSKVRTSYRTDFTKPAINFNDYFDEQMLLNLSNLTQSLHLQENAKQIPLLNNNNKKKVRFADSLGFELAETTEIVLYPSEDESRQIDDSYSSSDDSSPDNLDLDTFEFENIRSKWKCCFDQPGLNANFYNDLKERNILLEYVHMNHNILNGAIRIINLGMFKKVSIRYTLDNWKTYKDSNCEYNKSMDFDYLKTDQFTFKFELDKKLINDLLDENKYLPSFNDPIFKVKFALCFESFCDESMVASHGQYWDNNQSENYCFECYLNMIS